MSTSAPLVAFKKPSRRPQVSRRRSTSPVHISASESSVIRPTKKSLANPLIQGTKRRRGVGEETGGGLDELDYRADEGMMGGKGDVYATRSTDYDLDEGEKRGLGEKKIKLNEVGLGDVRVSWCLY